MSQCGQCGKTNSETARFCTGCGAKLDCFCPRCGAIAPEGARFCTECGNRLPAHSYGGAVTDHDVDVGDQKYMQYLDDDDEFYGISFSQASFDEVSGEAKILDVKAVTYALMSWWKRDGREDIIDISDDSNSSRLRFSHALSLEDEDAESSVTCIFEADEEQMLLTLFIYPEYFGLISKHDGSVNALKNYILDTNLAIPCGALEWIEADDGNSYGIRFRISACMQGVKKGKVAMVDNLLEHGMRYLSVAISMLADRGLAERATDDSVSRAAVERPKARIRQSLPDGSVVYLEHRQVWVGYAGGRIVCTRNSVESVMEFLKSRYNLAGTIVTDSGRDDGEA